MILEYSSLCICMWLAFAVPGEGKLHTIPFAVTWYDPSCPEQPQLHVLAYYIHRVLQLMLFCSCILYNLHLHILLCLSDMYVYEAYKALNTVSTLNCKAILSFLQSEAASDQLSSTSTEPKDEENQSVSSEIIVFQTNCSNCQSPTETRMKPVGILFTAMLFQYIRSIVLHYIS